MKSPEKMSMCELRVVANRAKRVLEKSGYGGWELQDAYAKLKEALCEHNYVDPSNEAVKARGHEICVKCGSIRRKPFYRGDELPTGGRFAESGKQFPDGDPDHD